MSFSKQRSVNVGERDVGSVSSTHCSNMLFPDFGYYLGFLFFE